MRKASISLSQLKTSKVADINRQLFEELERLSKKKRSKYGNTKTEVDGEVFDSIKEAEHYKTLLLRQKAGEIGLIKRQVEYELNPGGTHSLKYLADFEYYVRATGEKITEDVKGFRTREYKKKRRLMKKVHGIIIKEI